MEEDGVIDYPVPLIPKRDIHKVYLNQDLSLAAKALYGVLCCYADKQGMCWPSNGRLATDLNISPRQITRLLAELEKKGVISRFWNNGYKTMHTRLMY